MTDLLALFKSNEVLSGLVGGSLFASLLYALRTVPEALWEFLKWRCTCSLRVFSEDAAFERVNEWLSGLEYTKRARQLRLTVNYDDDRDENREILSPGLGKHLIWYKRGRADRREHIGELDQASVRAMCRRFFDDAAEGEEFAESVPTPIVPAELQERLLQSRREAA